jgi:O-antigen/teichoic acid export membrane protein
LKEKLFLPVDNSTPQTYREDLVKIAEGAGTSFIGKIAGGAIQYLYTIIIARILGAKSFGLFMLGLTVINLVGVISRLGLDVGVLRFVSLYNGVADKAKVKGTIITALKYTFIMSGFVIAVLILTGKPLFTSVLNKPELEKVVKLLSISLPALALMAIALAATQGFKVMKYTVYSQSLFMPISNIILTVVFYFMGLRLYGVVSAYLISTVFTSVTALYYLRKTFPEISSTTAVAETGKLFKFSIPLTLVMLLNFLILWTDTLMLGHFKTSETVGIYNVAMKTAMLTSIVLVSFNSIFAPIISDLYNRKEKEKFRSLFATVTKWIYCISLPVFLLIVLLAKEIMAVFGGEFTVGYEALIILAFAQLINSTAGSVGIVLTMSARQNIVMYNTIGICLLNITLNYFLIPRYGMTGAAMASGTSVIFLNIVMLLETLILLRTHPYSLKFIKITILAILALGVFLLAENVLPDMGKIWKLLISTTMFLGVYFGFIYKWGTDVEDEVIIDMLKNRLLGFLR